MEVGDYFELQWFYYLVIHFIACNTTKNDKTILGQRLAVTHTGKSCSTYIQLLLLQEHAFICIDSLNVTVRISNVGIADLATYNT